MGSVDLVGGVGKGAVAYLHGVLIVLIEDEIDILPLQLLGEVASLEREFWAALAPGHKYKPGDQCDGACQFVHVCV